MSWVPECRFNLLVSKTWGTQHTKIHPFSYADENQYFVSGDKLVSFELDGIKFSSFICYDLRFPEIFQASSQEAEVIIVPANWPEKRSEHWKVLLRARAIENQVYILGVNCVGNIGGIDYSGDSCIVSPTGEVLAENCHNEELLIYEIINETQRVRKEFPVKNDRKIDLYKQIL